MKSSLSQQPVASKFLLSFFAFFGSAVLLTNVAQAEAITPDVQAKVEKYQKKLAEWAANPTIVAAIKEANAKGPGAMNNGAWDDLKDEDPKVKSLQSSAAGKLLKTWEEDKGINKLFIRDEKGNLVASSNKALLFNNASRPQFSNSAKGQVWAGNEMKPDPTTQIMSVQISVPIMDGGKAIGVMNSSVSSK